MGKDYSKSNVAMLCLVSVKLFSFTLFSWSNPIQFKLTSSLAKVCHSFYLLYSICFNLPLQFEAVAIKFSIAANIKIGLNGNFSVA